jgi:hypothetical protein
MSIIITPDSEYGKEKVKWEAHHTQAGPPGRPYEFRRFPAMLYKADRIEHGPLGITERVKVESEREEQNMLSRGFFRSAKEAVEGKEAEQLEHAKLSAERSYDVVKRLGEKAREEVMRAEAVHGTEHLPAVPETPINRPVPASDDTLARQKATQRQKASAPADDGI